MTKRPSEKNKNWEKERRDRLNQAFERLSKLLPEYDPTVTWSKFDIIQKTIAYISRMQEKHEKLLESNDPKALDDYKQLVDTIQFFQIRNRQLVDLLKKAKITIPPAIYPKYTIDNAAISEKIDIDFISRPIGRAKKYSRVEKCADDNKPMDKDYKNLCNRIDEASKIIDTSTKPSNFITSIATTVPVMTIVTSMNDSIPAIGSIMTIDPTTSLHSGMNFGSLKSVSPAMSSGQTTTNGQLVTIGSSITIQAPATNTKPPVTQHTLTSESAVTTAAPATNISSVTTIDSNMAMGSLMSICTVPTINSTEASTTIAADSGSSTVSAITSTNQTTTDTTTTIGPAEKTSVEAPLVTPSGLASTTLPIHTNSNAIISTGVLIPVISCQSAILPTINAALPLLPTENLNSKSNEKCRIISIQTLPRLETCHKKLAKCKDGKIKILPYPTIKLHVRTRSDNKIPIPALKREAVVKVKKFRRNRKRKISKQLSGKINKKGKISVVKKEVSGKKTETITKKSDSNVPDSSLEKKIDCEKDLRHEDAPNFQVSIDSTLSKQDSATLPLCDDNDLAVEYFSTLQIPETNPNSTSVSPTAAFLMSFPLVHPSGGAAGEKNIDEVDDTTVENHDKNVNNNINEGLENLNNFFSTKEYYRYCNQNCDSPEKLPSEKENSELGGDGSKDGNKIEKQSNEGKSKIKIMSDKTNQSSTEFMAPRAYLHEAGATRTTVHTSTKGSARSTSAQISSVSTTCQPNTSYSQNVHLGKSSTCSSDFSVSNLFASNPLTSVSLPSNTITSTSSASTACSVAMSSKATPLYPQTSDMHSTRIFSTGGCISSTKLYTGSRLPKINPIPTPIPAAIPHPTNYPSTYSSCVALDKPTLPTTPITPSKSRSGFDVNSLFLDYSKSSPTKTANSAESASYTLSGKQKSLLHSSNRQKLESETTNQRPATSLQNRISFPMPATQNTTAKYSTPYDMAVVSTGKTDALPSTVVAQTKFSNAKSSASTSATKSSKTESVSKVLQSTATSLPARIVCPEGVLNTPNVNSVACSKDAQIFGVHSSASKSHQNNITDKNNCFVNSDLYMGDNSSYQLPFGFPPAQNHNYSAMLPQTNSSFSFTLSPTSTTPMVTSAVSHQSQRYFPYANVNNGVQWTPSSISNDFQTPFTFSLTSSTSTTSSSQSIRHQLQSKHNLPFADPLTSKTANSMSFNTSDNFNLVPEIVPSVTKSVVSHHSSGSTNNKDYSTMNFTFSLAKPQTTTTTASLSFMKSHLSSSTVDSKYQPVYNAYNYDGYSHLHSKESSTFTFALTNPTQTVSCTQSASSKDPQRFNSSFSIDTTLGVTNNSLPFQSQHPNLNNQMNSQNQKPALPNELNYFSPSISATKSLTLPIQQSHTKSEKVSQKSHVNWMTSSQNPGGSEVSQQPSTYYSPYPNITGDFNNKSHYYVPAPMEDNFSSWSPSKVLDTSHLFQATTSAHSYFNEINLLSSSAKHTTETQKSYSKSTDALHKTDKSYSRTSSSSTSNNNQNSFFSVSQLVDQNHPKPNDSHGRKAAQSKPKESRKNVNQSQNVYPQQKTSTRNNYSAEALISKKDKFNNPSLSTFQNPEYFSTQNDPVASASYPAVDADSFNYTNNYFYNFIPPNQNYIQDVDFIAPLLPNDTNSVKSGSNHSSRKNISKMVEKTVPVSSSSSSYYPAVATHSMHHHHHHPPTLPPIVPTLESFDSAQYNSNFQNTNWNVGKTTIGPYHSGQGVVVVPNEDDMNLSSCNHSGVVGSTGSNLTNFNLSTICPEISGKNGNSNVSQW